MADLMTEMAEAVDDLVADWGRQFARAAGIAAREPRS